MIERPLRTYYWQRSLPGAHHSNSFHLKNFYTCQNQTLLWFFQFNKGQRPDTVAPTIYQTSEACFMTALRLREANAILTRCLTRRPQMAFAHGPLAGRARCVARRLQV